MSYVTSFGFSTDLGLYLSGAFIGGVTSGLAGFALSLVLSGVWLHILPPIQAVTLIVGYGVLMYGYSIWKLRHALSWRKVAPFIVGGVGGVPIGVMLLAYINPAHVRAGIGLLLVLYCTYSLLRPKMKPIQAGVQADIGIGFLKRAARRTNGPRRYRRNHLVPISRLAERYSAHNLPAGYLRSICDERNIVEHHKSRHRGNW